ncbi:tripartite tricarboxylate transporter substrate binding protein [Nocardioides mesophilus]|uniref:Tripartite tricarboxylate transporter substrate binding protein n=2 Tax=Nocardioides mesophilus TaxID=433659 RepID=A0A7G9RGY1_9ACTN|nr:tripartite tricarboxylate transporter substrate binding protein [Nocardioides mesophilus]
MVPNAAGGGYDTTARTVAVVLEQEGITERPEIFNLEGGSGGVGLARTVHERGNPDLLMMMGLGVVGSVHTNDIAADLDQVTPVARLLSEPEVVLVRTTSEHRGLRSLVRAWREDPGSIVVGGGSLAGGPDHLATHLLAQAVRIDPRKVRYRQYDGGGPLLAALFTGRVDVAVSGVLENIEQVRAGAVRVLAVTGEHRVPGVEAPTLQEAGVPLEFANWRGFVAPPGLTPRERARLVSIVTRMHDSPSWREAEQANGWTDAFLTGHAFGSFLDEESARVRELLARLGMEPGEQQVTP